MVYSRSVGFQPGTVGGYQPSVVVASNIDLSGAIPQGQVGNCFSKDGELMIGTAVQTAGGTNTRMGFITSVDGSIGITNTSGNINLTGGNAAPFVPNAVLQEFDDFISSATGHSSKLVWDRQGATPFQSDGTTAHPGIYSIAPTAGQVGQFYLRQQNSVGTENIGPIALGGGITTINWVVQLSALSSGGNTYRFSCGLADDVTLSAQSDSYVNGVYFTYTGSVNSGNWQIKNTAASVTTTGSTTVAASTSFVTLSIVINAAATSVAYYIDGNQVSVSPLTTNIPTAALTPFVATINTAGTTPQYNIDLFWTTIVLSNPRPGPTNAAGSTTRTLIRQYTPTATSYQVLGGDSVIGVTDTGIARTITMPLAPTTGQEWTVKDVSLGAATNNITINGNGWNILGDSSSGTFVINTNGGSAEIFFDGTEFLII